MLWFGFGINHLVRDLASTSHGMSVLVLCGGLPEIMTTEMVALVLDELLSIYKAPRALHPSFYQWDALIGSRDGVTSKTNFAKVAELFMNFDDADSPVHPPCIVLRNAPGVRFRACGESKDIAAALHLIWKVSSQSTNAVELRGGAACGMLAALGYWFLGLEVEIRKGDTLVYRSISNEKPV